MYYMYIYYYININYNGYKFNKLCNKLKNRLILNISIYYYYI